MPPTGVQALLLAERLSLVYFVTRVGLKLPEVENTSDGCDGRCSRAREVHRTRESACLPSRLCPGGVPAEAAVGDLTMAGQPGSVKVHPREPRVRVFGVHKRHPPQEGFAFPLVQPVKEFLRIAQAKQFSVDPFARAHGWLKPREMGHLEKSAAHARGHGRRRAGLQQMRVAIAEA